MFNKSINSITRLKQRKLSLFKTTNFKFGGKSVAEKFGKQKTHLNISKIMAARPKKHRDMECEYHCRHT